MTTFSTSKAELKTAINIVKKALPKAVISEERGHILFTLSGGKVKLSGTNNDFMAFYILDAEHSEDFGFTCDPKLLEKYLSKSETESVSGEYDKEKLALKLFTTDDQKSYLTFQSFPTNKMLTFDKNYGLPQDNQKELIRTLALKAIKFTGAYLLPAKEDGRNNDYLIINDKVIYGGNGVNRRGYFVTNDLSGINNLKIRKLAVPVVTSVLEKMGTDKVVFFENPRIAGIETPDRTVFFGFLKSDVAPPKMPLDFLKKDGPFTRVNKTLLVKRMERLSIANTNLGRIGVKLRLSGKGESSILSVSLLEELESIEKIPCERINDEGGESIEHVVEYKMFLEMVSVFTAGENIDLYINKQDKAFKIYEVGRLDEEKYIAVGAGSYAKVIG